jgi:hypothetical protein
MHVNEEMRANDLLNSSNLGTLRTLLSLPGQEALDRIDRLLTEPTHYGAQLINQRKEFSTRLTAIDGNLFDD